MGVCRPGPRIGDAMKLVFLVALLAVFVAPYGAEARGGGGGHAGHASSSSAAPSGKHAAVTSAHAVVDTNPLAGAKKREGSGGGGGLGCEASGRGSAPCPESKPAS